MLRKATFLLLCFLLVAGEETTPTVIPEQSFYESFFASLSMIVLSEIGDKTFFIAAILAMKHSRLLIFSSATAALALMTVLSVVMGLVVPSFLSPAYTKILASLLFLVFGGKMLYDGYYLSPSAGQEEMEEVRAEIEGKETDPILDAAEKGTIRKLSIVSPVVIQTFSMTFLAEWGDRSQISTIALAASGNVLAVTLGSFLGHSACTALAVLGGRILASRISVKSRK